MKENLSSTPSTDEQPGPTIPAAYRIYGEDAPDLEEGVGAAGWLTLAAIGTVALIAFAAGRAFGGPLQPPERFDHPYDGPVVVEKLPTDNVRRHCVERFGTDWGASTMKGCGGVVDGVCYVIVGRYAKVSSLPMLIRHEIAHCNGWTAEHEK